MWGCQDHHCPSSPNGFWVPGQRPPRTMKWAVPIRKPSWVEGESAPFVFPFPSTPRNFKREPKKKENHCYLFQNHFDFPVSFLYFFSFFAMLLCCFGKKYESRRIRQFSTNMILEFLSPSPCPFLSANSSFPVDVETTLSGHCIINKQARQKERT